MVMSMGPCECCARLRPCHRLSLLRWGLARVRRWLPVEGSTVQSPSFAMCSSAAYDKIKVKSFNTEYTEWARRTRKRQQSGADALSAVQNSYVFWNCNDIASVYQLSMSFPCSPCPIRVFRGRAVRWTPLMNDTRDAGLVVVTGANGFIGRHLCQSLAQKGVRVRGITRSKTGIPIGGVETAIARDLHDRDGIRAAMTGAGTVIHLAARVHANAEGRDDPASECRRVNVDGTALLLEEAVAAGATGFFFISSVKAVAGESDRMLTADTPPLPVDPYGESKLEGEHLVKVAATREGLHAPILRLPNVYGPGMKANMITLFKVIDRGIPLPLGSVRNRRSFAYVANVVGAIEALITSPKAAHETVYVSDEHDVSTPDLVRSIARAL